jgi:hypothetical protein
MRRQLILPLSAALVFLPCASATPPPQGWEERNELRAGLPEKQTDLQKYRELLANLQIKMALLAAEFAGRVEPAPDLRNGDERYLNQQRQLICDVERELRRREEEVARIERRLGK